MMVVATISVMTSCTKTDVAAGITFSVSGNASGSQAVPSNRSSGNGTFSGTYNQSTRVLAYTSAWTNLSGAPVAAGFYSGTVGQVGASIASWALGAGLAISGSFSGSTTLSKDQETQLLAGNVYYLLTTTANATGEVRGQLSVSRQ